MGRFALPIESLAEAPEAYAFEANAGWWHARDPEPDETFCEVEEPFRFSFEARLVGDDVVLEGRMQSRVALECSRCAKRYSHALCEDFRLVLEPAGSREPADPDGVAALAKHGLWLGEDLEAGWFRGARVQLDDFFGEVIALAMPLQPLCSDECPGICPHCGADRAEVQRACADEKIDSPFAVLAKLKGAEGDASESG